MKIWSGNYWVCQTYSAGPVYAWWWSPTFLYIRIYTVYTVHLMNIKIGKLECKANWQTFSLVNKAMLSVDSLSDTHNTLELTYIKCGNWIRNHQTTKFKSPPNVLHIRYIYIYIIRIYGKDELGLTFAVFTVLKSTAKFFHEFIISFV